jgi:hypothetical protein
MYPKGIGGNYDRKEEEYIEKTKLIEGTQCLISGSTGSGKTNAIHILAEEFHNHGATVITITEKINSEMDFAFTDFKPSKESEGNFYQIHESLLKRQKEEATAYPTIIYHPFTFEISKSQMKNLPGSFTFFTIPVKDLTPNSLRSLFGGDVDKNSVKIIQNIINKMKPEETLFDLLWKIYNKIEQSKDDKIIADEETGFVPSGTTSNKKTRNEILEAFQYFLANPIIENKSKRNLDIQKMILDNKHYHLLTVKWVSNPIIKYFCYIWLIDQIMKNLGMMKKAPLVVLVFEELRVLLPNKDKYSSSYQQVLSQVTKDVLSTARKINSTSVTTLANTQVMFDTDADYRSTCNMKLIGVPADEDIKIFGKDYQFPAETLRNLKSLKIGEFMWWMEGYPTFVAETPKHAMPTQGHNYLNVFEKVYPERMKDYSPLYEEMKQKHKEWMSQSKDKKNELEKKIDEEKKREREQKEQTRLNRDLAQRQQLESLKNKQREAKILEWKKCYELKQQGLSVREIAGKIYGDENKEKKKDSVTAYIKKYEALISKTPQENSQENNQEQPV